MKPEELIRLLEVYPDVLRAAQGFARQARGELRLVEDERPRVSGNRDLPPVRQLKDRRDALFAQIMRNPKQYGLTAGSSQAAINRVIDGDETIQLYAEQARLALDHQPKQSDWEQRHRVAIARVEEAEDALEALRAEMATYYVIAALLLDEQEGDP